MQVLPSKIQFNVIFLKKYKSKFQIFLLILILILSKNLNTTNTLIVNNTLVKITTKVGIKKSLLMLFILKGQFKLLVHVLVISNKQVLTL